MQKITIAFGLFVALLAFNLTPLSAQGTSAPADPPATTNVSGSNATGPAAAAPRTYRGIIPGAEDANGGALSNKDITCDTVERDSSLGEKIHCGKVSLNDFPILVVYLVQWLLTLAGAIAVIMVMVGGFQYIFGGLTDDKERGKKTLIYAVGGLIVAFMAWWIVELIQVWITS